MLRGPSGQSRQPGPATSELHLRAGYSNPAGGAQVRCTLRALPFPRPKRCIPDTNPALKTCLQPVSRPIWLPVKRDRPGSCLWLAPRCAGRACSNATTRKTTASGDHFVAGFEPDEKLAAGFVRWWRESSKACPAGRSILANGVESLSSYS